jgi:hypothetical protein
VSRSRLLVALTFGVAAALAAALRARSRAGEPGRARGCERDRGEQRRAPRPLCVHGAKPVVQVTVGAATGRARAEIRYDCLADPGTAEPRRATG